jgi:chitin-binding protein
MGNAIIARCAKCTSLAGTMLAATVCSQAPAFGHGSMESPISRVYACYKENPENPSSPACIAAANYSKQALYDWNGVLLSNVDGAHRARIPDGKLCSAGNVTFSALDAPRDDWPATAITADGQGDLRLSFRATAPHAIAYFRLYVTDQGYDPEEPLRWSTLEPEPFCELGSDEIVKSGDRYELSCPFPTGLEGRHLIYAIWQRSDSKEAFYSCSDVLIGTDQGDPGEPRWQDLGAVVATTDLQDGSEVTFRLFGEGGSDEETFSIVVDGPGGKKESWPYALATQVNGEQSWVALGVLEQSGAVRPQRSATANHVYVADPGAFRFAIDVSAPDPEPVPDPDDSWEAVGTYVAGDEVVFHGVTYEAQWWTRGDTPGASAVWQRTTPSEGPVVWNFKAVYVAGDEVDYQGIAYEAQWWTQGDTPGASAVWQRTTPTDGPIAWNAGAVFRGGDEVIYEGVVYRAKWWTQGEVPPTSDVWEAVG